MSAIQRTLKIETNADLYFSVRWKDSTGTPQILSDALLQIRPDYDGTPLLDLSPGSGITLDPSEGWATVYVSQAELASVTWPDTKLYWDIVLTRESDGRAKRTHEGQVLISPGISHV